MVRLTTVRETFHARVIAARLGAEGVLTQLRGNVDGPYPMGDVHVYVDEHDLPAAQELLMADEVESAFEEGGVDATGLQRAPELWIVLGAILLVAAVLFSRSV
jgi:hypothetical protein